MSLRRVLIATFVAAVAVGALAAISPERVEWGKGPVQFLMTKAEIAQWKTIKSDEEADKFVALFWARRDPTPGTPRNEFREQYEKRVLQADANFKSDKLRGAMTDRGRTLILFGMPSKIERSGDPRAQALPAGITPTAAADQGTKPFVSGANDPAAPVNLDKTEGQVWTYEGPEAKTMFNIAKARVRFTDRHGNSNFTMERDTLDFAAAQQRVIAAAITQPNLTEAPKFEQQAAAPVAEPEPEQVQTELANEALKSAVTAFKASPKSEKPLYVTTGEYVTNEGQTFAPVLLYVPKSAGLTDASDVTFFGVVEDANGKGVVAFEQPAKLTPTKDDYFIDKSLTLPGGKYRGIFGLAQNGKAIAIASTDMELTGAIDKTASTTSPVLLSNNVYALKEAQSPTDPFAFGGLKVVPNASKTFRKSEELSYFVELRNPGIAEGATAPAIQVKLDVEGTDPATGKKVKRSAPPMEMEAFPVKGVEGHYFIGTGVPLQSFTPGEYTFTVKVIDTVKKSSTTLTDKFKVVE